MVDIIKYTKEDGKPNLSGASIIDYFKTRPTTLFDIPMLKDKTLLWERLNPLPGLSEMTLTNWSFYGLGFFAWTIDSMDFFCVSAAASEIANTLEVDIEDITWGVTLVLMVRTIGAIIFGVLSDHYGRKWPFIACCVLFIIFEIGTGFVQTYEQFLVVRALFGIAMGGMYGNAAATALEDQPKKARSILSGLYQPGYNFGYLLAVVFFRAFENTYKGDQGWRSLFWFSAGLPVILICWRLCYGESVAFKQVKEKRKLDSKNNLEHCSPIKILSNQLRLIFRTDWLMLLYLVALMAVFHFMSHGSQDLYPTLLEKQHDVGSNRKTVIMVIVNLGAIAGGLLFGQMTELLGRRLTIIICCIMGGAFIYPSFFSNDLNTITGGYFFLCFATMGAWGVAPLHLMELVNKDNRVFLSGIGMYLNCFDEVGYLRIEY
ncbi:MAG: MFS transporter [Staphylococcus equorum]|nr:MFS transporter [Staphylococcus equorum]MDN6571740.1 MFS transporter [Staphylococcus equorum]